MRQLTLSTDKDKYGIRLRAEPDHMVLGKKLKAAFKAITASIKELTSEQLEVFQKTGISMSFCVPQALTFVRSLPTNKNALVINSCDHALRPNHKAVVCLV